MKDGSLPEITSHADFIAQTRSMLTLAGLTRKSLDGTVYWTGGDGERTLALIHGVNDHAGTWSLVAPALLKSHRLIIPDLPGHGDSEPKTGALDMQQLVDRLGAVFDAEGIARVTLVGNSMGAWISILYTLAHPSRVAELFLESGGGLAIPLGVSLVASNRDEAVPILQAVHGPNAQFPDWAIDASPHRRRNDVVLHRRSPRRHPRSGHRDLGRERWRRHTRVHRTGARWHPGRETLHHR
jgi:pimeloyl-ACP methyl ester carboxylesterase